MFVLVCFITEEVDKIFSHFESYFCKMMKIKEVVGEFHLRGNFINVELLKYMQGEVQFLWVSPESLSSKTSEELPVFCASWFRPPHGAALSCPRFLQLSPSSPTLGSGCPNYMVLYFPNQPLFPSM
jgi:hypothetical protein